jgi:hypothetical protein
MIYVSGDQRHGHLDKRGKENHDMHPYNGIWISDQEHLALRSNVLVDVRNTTIMLRGSNNMVFQVRVGVEDHKKYSRNNSRNSQELEV